MLCMFGRKKINRGKEKKNKEQVKIEITWLERNKRKNR